ncbi:unnamed protein product [Cylicostephanus goldi]|uniref:Uncharacterized protein n=1 Tax=Cylicostephanus goldi TaxID=71465 RepID=A0A3P6QRT7_CYLGO|nr:unnamed protein product [Cylicostephanus goldi]
MLGNHCVFAVITFLVSESLTIFLSCVSCFLAIDFTSEDRQIATQNQAGEEILLGSKQDPILKQLTNMRTGWFRWVSLHLDKLLDLNILEMRKITSEDCERVSKEFTLQRARWFKKETKRKAERERRELRLKAKDVDRSSTYEVGFVV